MHKTKILFFIFILLCGLGSPIFAAPTQPAHAHANQHKHKSTVTKNKKKIHHKSSHTKQIKKKKPKKTRVMKPHIVTKNDNAPISSSTPQTSNAPQVSNVSTTMPRHSFYRILTQPMTSSPTMAATHLPVEHTYGFTAAIEQRLVNFVHKTVDSLRYSTYKLGGTHIDSSQGIYIVDCSGYVDHTLRVVYPNAYLSLVDSSGVNKPNTSHYYDFFTNLTNDPNWSRVKDIEQLQPGDILVFRYKNMRGRSTGGHVMVVMDKPERNGNDYLVSVADSAASGHSDDTRRNHVSGIGIGSLLLKVDPKTRQPSAYAWTLNSPWRKNVNFAMARPLNSHS